MPRDDFQQVLDENPEVKTYLEGLSADRIKASAAAQESMEVLDADDLLIEEPRRRKDPLSGLPEPHEHFDLDQYLKSVRKQLKIESIKSSRLLGTFSVSGKLKSMK